MITGLYGCSCHPFNSWEECDKYHKQKFEVGDPVTQRHTGRSGSIHQLHETKGFVIVKYGPLPKNLELEHVAMLQKL
jgi:hypothetical protein